MEKYKELFPSAEDYHRYIFNFAVISRVFTSGNIFRNIIFLNVQGTVIAYFVPSDFVHTIAKEIIYFALLDKIFMSDDSRKELAPFGIAHIRSRKGAYFLFQLLYIAMVVFCGWK